MKRVLISIVLVVCAGSICKSSRGQQAPAAPQTQPATAQADLDKKFQETMTNATMTGHFIVSGNEQNQHNDHYTIVSAKKLMGDLWVITAKIEYRGEAVAIPLVVPVKWAGDTPVIGVTDMSIPGMGSYTARVMIYKDQYTGMWDAGTHGGLMWGKIEHTASATAPTTAPSVSN
jgi:hypothetical protein